VNDAPDEGRGHDRLGPYQRPKPEELCGRGSVPHSSSSERKTLTGDATRRNQQPKAAYTADTAGRAGDGPTQTQASESVSENLQEPECASKLGGSSESTQGQASQSASECIQKSVDLSKLGNPSKAAETLRCARSGGPGPSAEAAATEGPEGPRRQAGRSRGGRGAESAGWREMAAWCHAEGGAEHE
jgi:hypothetical protein